MREEKNKEEFKELAPQLKQLLDKEREQASLPNNYFQNFEARLQQRLATEQSLEPTAALSPKSQWRTWWQQIWKPLTALAVPALAVLLWVGLLPNEEEPAPANFMALSKEVSNQEIDLYIEQNLEQFTVMDLLAMDESEVLENWKEGIVPAATPAPTPSVSDNSFEKAVESTQSDDLLDELTTEDLSLEEDWF